MSKVMVSARVPEKLGEDLEALAEATRRSKAFLVTMLSYRNYEVIVAIIPLRLIQVLDFNEFNMNVTFRLGSASGCHCLDIDQP